MATIRQKRLARKIPEILASAQDITGAQLVASVGYSAEMQKKPGTILRSPGVQEELTKMGFTEENASKVVAQILSDEGLRPEPRLKAAEMVFKVHGSFAPERHLNVNVEIEANEEIRRVTQQLNDLYRRTGSASDGGTAGALGTEASDKERDGASD